MLFPVLGDFNFTSVAQARSSAPKNYIESEVVAKIKPGADVDAIAEKYNLDAELLKAAADGNLYVLKSEKNIATKKLISTLEKNSAIISVQPNFKYKPLGRIANDSLFSSQWSLADTASVAGGVSASSAWDIETKNKNKVPIAIIDSGVCYDHHELKDRITGGRAQGKNFVSPKKKPSDADGHGTFLAGIIAAKTNNKRGMSGASFWGNIKIMPLKFDFTTDQAISALSYAKARNIPIVNASWGAYGADGLDPLLQDAIAGYPGIFVTAAGNDGMNHESGSAGDRMYPCDFDLPNIVCVGASDRNGALADYSDFGAISVDVAAPGGTDGDPIIGLDKKKGRYTNAEGSSLSTAFVSAEAGLILSQKPYLGAAQIVEIIKNSVDAEPSMTGKVSTGGKINFQKALELSANY